MNRIPMVGAPALSQGRVPASGPSDAVPESGTAIGGGMGEFTPRVGLTFLLVWVMTGIAAALVLRQRGHHFGSTAALGLVFGPLFIPLAVQYRRARQSEAGPSPVRVAAGSTGPGPVNVGRPQWPFAGREPVQDPGAGAVAMLLMPATPATQD